MRSSLRWVRRDSAPSKRLFLRPLPVVEEGAPPNADVVGAGIRPFRPHLLADTHALLLGALDSHALGVLFGAPRRIARNDVAVALRVRVLLTVDDAVVVGDLLLVHAVVDRRALLDDLPRDREPDLVFVLNGVGDRLW